MELILFLRDRIQNSTMQNVFPTELILSVNRALLGEVSPELRAVLVRKSKDNIYIKTIYDGDISAQDRESSSIIATGVIADYPENCHVIEECIRLDAPEKINCPEGWHLVFSRRE